MSLQLQTYASLTPTNVGPKSAGSIVEDLRDFVENTSATDRPALALLRKSRIRTHYVEWLEDTLLARAENAQTEGASASNAALTTPSRNTAVAQIFASWGEVSDVQRAVEHAGLDDMFFYQERKHAKELLNDIEHAIHRGTMTTGTSGTARKLKGFLNVLSTNFTSSSGTTLTEDVFGDHLQMFVDGNTEIRPSVCFVNSYLKRTLSQYSTKVTRNVQAAQRIQQLVVDRYESDFGAVDIFYSRDQLMSASKTTFGNSFVIIDPKFFETGWLQMLQSETLARSGLSTQFQLSAMCTLIYRSEKGGGGGADYVAYLPPAT